MKDENLAQIIGQIIREERQLNWNYSLERAGEEIGIDANNLGRIERGEQLPKTKTLMKIINTLDIDFLIHKENTSHAINEDEDQ